MITASPDYKNAVVQGTRSTVAIIYFGVYDVTAKDDATITVPTQSFTSTNAMKGSIRDQDFKAATFEDDYFKLDGSAYLMPDDANPNDIIGWWSQQMSDANRSFVNPVTITIQFVNFHSSQGIGIFFGSDEYCTDFDVTWYDGATVLGTSSIVANASKDCNIKNPINNYKKIVIKFTKTRNPYRYVKVMELEFGLESIFDSDKLINATIIEEVDPSGSSLSFNTLKFSVLNDDQAFNMLNPTGIYQYLQKRQKIVVRSGLMTFAGVYEYVNLGTFFLSDWKNPNGITASLEATDAIGILGNTTYKASPYWVNEPVENVLRHILNDAGGQVAMTITVAAGAEKVTGYVPVKSHREALADVLMASRNTLRVDRSGILNVIKLDFATSLSTVDFSTMLGSPTISQKPLITSVEVKEFTYVVAAAATDLAKTTFDLTGQQTFVIDYGGKAASAVSAVVTGAGTVVGTPVYSAVAVTITINGTGTLTVTVSGKEYIESSKTVSASVALLAGEVSQIANISENKLVSAGKGTGVAQQLLDYFKKRIHQSFSFWSDPTIQAGDCISVLTMFGTNYKGVVERQEISVVPKLQAKLEVTG